MLQCVLMLVDRCVLLEVSPSKMRWSFEAEFFNVSNKSKYYEK